MSNLITKIVDYSIEQIDLIKRTLLDTEKVTYSKDELALFINQCKRTGLDPFTRQIYATKTGGKMTVQATIDGLRLIAERSTKYAGQTRPVFFDKDGNEYRVWPKNKGMPYACEVGVLRHDFKEPVYAIAIFDEYAPMNKDYKTGEMKLGFMWNKMPALMLSKVAEALALRRAFPNDLSGIYSKEEMSDTDDVEKDVTESKPVQESNNIQTKGMQIESIKEEPPKLIKAPNLALGVYEMKAGRFSGKKLNQLNQLDLKKYIQQCELHAVETKKELPLEVQENIWTIKEFLGLE